MPMARPKPSSVNDAMPIRMLRCIYAALASMPLAVVLLITLAFVLGWATFIESEYGTEAVHFAVYDAWWFAGLLGLLGVNVLCAALIRLPWKRHQTGFVITHAGILVLLVGCIFSATDGIDAQMYVLEGGTAHLAYADTRHFEIKIFPDQSTDGKVTVIDVPFNSGPFSWSDYHAAMKEPYWHVVPRDTGTVCNQQGIQLEVLDFYRIWVTARAMPLRIRAAATNQATGQLEPWTSLDLSIDKMQQAGLPTAGVQERLDAGVRFTFSVANSRAESEAFRLAAPEGELGEAGQLVLFARGQVFRYQADNLNEGDRLKLGDTGYEAEFLGRRPSFLGVDLNIHPARGESERMRLFAEMPEFNRQAEEHAVFGSYWVDPASSAVANATMIPNDPKEPRVDLIQDIDGKLLYRVWRSSRLQPAQELPVGSKVELPLDGEKNVVRFYVDESFKPHDYPGIHFAPESFDKNAARRSIPLVRVRLTVDGRAEEFWLLQWQPRLFDHPVGPLERHVIVGDGRRVELMLRPDATDVGLNVYLDKFQRKLDPGSSSMVSHYSSLVDFVTVKRDPKTDKDVVDDIVEEGVFITLNEPVTRTDPNTGRSYRIYQEAFDGPWKPGSDEYDEHLGGRVLQGEKMPRDELYQSTLTFNYDPGRGLKYFGCLMIVAGIAAMFYMKAYFFARRPRQGQPEPGTE